MSLCKTAIDMLGVEAEDIVTGVRGMVSSICFDAYGCVQAVIAQKVKSDGAMPESFWVDVKRLKVVGNRIMAAPDFALEFGQEAGPADKPIP